eukprot:2758121-Amphidinium_carterae.1
MPMFLAPSSRYCLGFGLNMLELCMGWGSRSIYETMNLRLRKHRHYTAVVEGDEIRVLRNHSIEITAGETASVSCHIRFTQCPRYRCSLGLASPARQVNLARDDPYPSSQ